MTSKVDLNAPADSDDALEDAFFSRPPPPVVHEVEHPEDWGPPPAMSRRERSVMVATSGMVAAALLVLVAFSAFHDTFVMRRAPVTAAPSPSQVLAAVSDTRLQGATMATAQAAAAAPALPPPPPAAPSGLPTAAEPAVEPPVAAEPAAAAETPSASEAAEPAPTALPAPTAPSARAASSPAKRPVKRAAARVKPRTAPVRRASKPSSDFDRTILAARRAFDRGDAAGAQRKALDAIQLDASRGYAYVLLGAARDALGNAAGARAAYRLCVQQAKDRHVAACKQLAR